MMGIVIDVKNYYLDEKTRRILNTDNKHQQTITWVTTSGYEMRFCWDDQKPFRNDVDYRDFPDGFKPNDFIKITEKGAFIVKVERITLDEIRQNLVI